MQYNTASLRPATARNKRQCLNRFWKWNLGSFYLFKIYLFYVSTVLFSSDTPEESIKSHNRRLWATMWVLGIELRTSGRAVSALNSWAISPAQGWYPYWDIPGKHLCEDWSYAERSPGPDVFLAPSEGTWLCQHWLSDFCVQNCEVRCLCHPICRTMVSQGFIVVKRHHDHSKFYKGKHSNYSFRGSVYYHHGRKHGNVQADMVLEKELWVLHLDLQAAAAAGDCVPHWA